MLCDKMFGWSIDMGKWVGGPGVDDFLSGQEIMSWMPHFILTHVVWNSYSPVKAQTNLWSKDVVSKAGVGADWILHQNA